MWRVSTLGRTSLSWALQGGNPAVFTGASRVGPAEAASTAGPSPASGPDPVLASSRRLARDASSSAVSPAHGSTLLSNLDALVDTPAAAARSPAVSASVSPAAMRLSDGADVLVRTHAHAHAHDAHSHGAHSQDAHTHGLASASVFVRPAAWGVAPRVAVAAPPVPPAPPASSGEWVGAWLRAASPYLEPLAHVATAVLAQATVVPLYANADAAFSLRESAAALFRRAFASLDEEERSL